MSVQRECVFLESTPGEWYYILERTDAPRDAYDWLDYAEAFGPFRSESQAHDHLHRHHANPGGSHLMRYTPENKRFRESAGVIALLKKATTGHRRW